MIGGLPQLASDGKELLYPSPESDVMLAASLSLIGGDAYYVQRSPSRRITGTGAIRQSRRCAHNVPAARFRIECEVKDSHPNAHLIWINRVEYHRNVISIDWVY